MELVLEEDPPFAMLQRMTEKLIHRKVEQKVGTEKGSHPGDQTTYGSGNRLRRFDARMGTTYLLMPKLRKGGHVPFFATERRRSEVALIEVAPRRPG